LEDLGVISVNAKRFRKGLYLNKEQEKHNIVRGCLPTNLSYTFILHALNRMTIFIFSHSPEE
jgi:hypothetical protein